MVEWILDDIYDVREKKDKVNLIEKLVEEFKTFREELKPDLTEKRFMEIFKKYEELNILTSELNALDSLKLYINTANPQLNAETDKISDFSTKKMNETIFFNLWFKDLNEASAKKYIEAANVDKYYFKRLREFKKYILTEKEERIIGLKDLSGIDSVVKAYEIITNSFEFDLFGEKHTMSQLNRYKLSEKRYERVAAYNILLEKFKKEKAVLGELYRSVVNDWHNENLVIRGYANPLSPRNLGNDVDDDVVNYVLDGVEKATPIFQDYFRLKTKILGLDKMDRYDLYAPSTKPNNKFSFEKSSGLVLSTYTDFNSEMGVLGEKILRGKHIHSDLGADKVSGAFCMSYSVGKTPYILLNHNDGLDDVFTLMHEMGHGIHSLLCSDLTEFTFHSSLVLAETASLFGEMLLSKRLMGDADPKMKKALLMRMLDNQYASILRQGYFTKFEEYAHENVPKGISSDDLSEFYLESLRNQFGDVMDVGDLFRHEWMYIPHFYSSPFYCYSYCFGNLLVLSLFKHFETIGESFADDFIGILSKGGSDSPGKILADHGFDISKKEFWLMGVDALKSEVDLLKKLV